MRYLLFGLLLVAPAVAEAQEGAKKQLLVITESKGFRHGCVTRKVSLAQGLAAQDLAKVKIDGLVVQITKKIVEDKKTGEKKEVESVNIAYNGRIPSPKTLELKDGDKVVAKVEPCLVEKTFMELGAKHGFEAVCSQDSRAEIHGDNLKKFDAVWFYTTGSLPMSDTQKSDLLAFVRSGKGFAGSHSATDTFYNWKEYGELIGGYFDGHPWTQKIRIIVEDQKHPATRHLGEAFEIDDEIYQFRTPYSRDRLRILMRMDMGSVKNQGSRKDGDNALAWVQQYGKGRVFYTALGHRDQVWQDPRYQEHVLGGLRFIFGQEDAETTPSGGRSDVPAPRGMISKRAGRVSARSRPAQSHSASSRCSARSRAASAWSMARRCISSIL